MVLPLMRYLQLHSSWKFVRAGLGISMLLTGVAVLGTYSRGGLIALAVVLGALFLKSRGRLAVLLIVVAVGFAAYHLMPPQWTQRMGTLHDATQTDSGETRIQSYKFAVNVALHRPVLGGGFNVYQSDVMWQRYGPAGAIPRAVHSIYLRILGEQGFPGLGLFLALLLVSWKACSKVRKRTRDVAEERWTFDLASMLQVSLVAFMAAGTFLPMSYFDLAYQLMALCAVLQLQVRQHASQPAETQYRRRARALLPSNATPKTLPG
jgi:probable O-glycosylation ligase (exosortase A-associated)